MADTVAKRAMAEIINLRIARKARKRADDETRAAENRVKFGRTKTEKAAQRADQIRTDQVLDGARRDRKD
jgi:hypothetical protein